MKNHCWLLFLGAKGNGSPSPSTPSKSLMKMDGFPSPQRAKRMPSVCSKNGGVTLRSPQMQSFLCDVFLGLSDCHHCSALITSTSRSGWGQCKLTQHLVSRSFFKWQKIYQGKCAQVFKSRLVHQVSALPECLHLGCRASNLGTHQYGLDSVECSWY